MSINRGMGKEDEIHIYSRKILTIKRNKISLFGEIWMDPETVIHTEVRNRKTNIAY